jgi:hypothetical protein
MRRLLLLVTVFALVTAACGGDGTADGPDPEAVARGIVAYEAYCQVCHGIEGAGVEGLGKPIRASSRRVPIRRCSTSSSKDGPRITPTTPRESR